MRQTDEELSFADEAILSVYDTSDPDWTLVGLNGEFGFAPANYIELGGEAETKQAVPKTPLSPPLPTRTVVTEGPPSPTVSPGPPSNPTATLANIIGRQNPPPQVNVARSLPVKHVQFTPEASDDEEPPPSLPQRPVSQDISVSSPRRPSPPAIESPTSPIRGIMASPPMNRAVQDYGEPQRSPGGYHLYNINEMVSVMGKQKKMPTTLGINLATGIILIIPEKKRDGPQQEWTADKLTHYSIEGKHVFMELVKPSRSIDFHAGAKDTANEIVSSLGELAGMVRQEGLKEVIAAGRGTSQKKGRMLYEFNAQGEDEVTVADGDDVIVLDDISSEEWWKVRRLKNGVEGVVPSSYVEIDTAAPTSPRKSSTSGLNAGRSIVEQNRRAEEQMTKAALGASRKRDEGENNEVGPGMRLPYRGSSLMATYDGNSSSSQRSKRESRSDSKASASKSSRLLPVFKTWASANLPN